MTNIARWEFVIAGVASALALSCAPAEKASKLSVEPAAERTLAFSIPEGRALNEFYRAGPIAAHLMLTDGRAPRLVTAFPAGNSGVGLWFEEGNVDATWRMASPLRGVKLEDGGRTLRGIEAKVTVEAPSLTIKRAILGNVRSLRNYIYTGQTTPDLEISALVSDNRVEWRRKRLDGAVDYLLSLDVLEGSVRVSEGRITLAPDGEGKLQIRVSALTGETPLTPIPQETLFTIDTTDTRSLQVLAFLSYREKLLAGSWRFLTYFGRDTLLTLKMLEPAASPELMEAGISSVLDRLNAGGEVAHEEDIAEYAILRRAEADEPLSSTPFYDYAMIDDNLLLAPVASDYLLDRADGQARAAAFLERPTKKGETYGAALVRNLAFVIDTARPFSEAPARSNLIHLKEGEYDGNWRDSEEGLGGGHTPYDVNAALIPAALAAASRLHLSGALDAYLDEESNAKLTKAGEMAAIWESHAPGYFRVTIGNAAARERITAYGAPIGVPMEAALASLGGGEIEFNALVLDKDGTPLPVLHSDESFRLAFTDPPTEALNRILDTIMRPFPAGLVTPAGILSANAAYAPADRQKDFSNAHYHGAVVWSWQQALLATGLERQRRRSDLDPDTLAKLEAAQHTLWEVIDAGEAVKTSELWTWSVRDGAFAIEPFGQRAGDVTESNAAQLWSTVYLGVHRPSGD